MDPIREGAQGAAVEDIQDRLSKVGLEIDAAEKQAKQFGPSTAAAVAKFRLDQGLSLGTEVDSATWSKLVDACYELGDRTLYLRLPNFHGQDVFKLQTCLNILGFSCGEPDGYFGVYTESAVKQFQESQGMLADGMAFGDTFAAILRLHHVWAGKPATGPHPMGVIGFARAASVLEHVTIALTAEDPISRNVAGRIWNLATATNPNSGIILVGDTSEIPEGTQCILSLASTHPEQNGVSNLVTDDIETLPLRLRSTLESIDSDLKSVRLELPLGQSYDGSFTTGDAQTFAVMLLDAICAAFD